MWKSYTGGNAAPVKYEFDWKAWMYPIAKSETSVPEKITADIPVTSGEH